MVFEGENVEFGGAEAVDDALALDLGLGFFFIETEGFVAHRVNDVTTFFAGFDFG
jgi:hypothetical protein